MEDELERHKNHIEDLIAHHEQEEEQRIAALEESVKWYEAEMVKVGGISLNPLSWKKNEIRGNSMEEMFNLYAEYGAVAIIVGLFVYLIMNLMASQKNKMNRLKKYSRYLLKWVQ